MKKIFKPKKIIKNQQYDAYWKLTVEYTDIFDRRFNNTLKIIVTFIDENKLTNSKYDPKLYKKLQDKISNVFPKSDKASVRKSINQFVKIGFIFPYLKGYHKLTKKFLNTTNPDEKKSIFSKIFYECSSFNSSVTNDQTNTRETNFLLKTLSYKPNKILSKQDIIGLMVTPAISEIKKGYLTEYELTEQYNYAKAIHFEEKKYNQIRYLFTFLSLMPNIIADKRKGISFMNPDEVSIDSTRDPILYNIYKSDLKKESIRIYGKEVCYLEKKQYKGLICSHIKDSSVCLSEGDIDSAYDYNNGLLLQPNLDAYFDKYNISFKDDGNILINDSEIKDIDILQELRNLKLDDKLLTQERLKYLNWHRNQFFKKAKIDKHEEKEQINS